MPAIAAMEDSSNLIGKAKAEIAGMARSYTGAGEIWSGSFLRTLSTRAVFSTLIVFVPAVTSIEQGGSTSRGHRMFFIVRAASCQRPQGAKQPVELFCRMGG